MVRSYLRHGPTEVFGLVCSATSNALYDGNLAFVPGIEDVLVWDVKRGEKVGMWHATGHTSSVTALSRSPVDSHLFAAGYQDGSIRLWSLANGTSSKEATIRVVLEGHRRGVTSLAWDGDGTRLASGAADGEVVIWDVVGDVGLFRLRAHRDSLTSLAFLSAPARSDPTTSTSPPLPFTHLVTASKDTFVKLWDLSSQHCVETVTAHRSGAWGVAILPAHSPTTSVLPEGVEGEEAALEDRVLLSTGGDGEAKLWTVSTRALLYGPQYASSNGTNGAVSNATEPAPLLRSITSLHDLTLSSPGATSSRISLPSVHQYSLPGGVRGTAVAVQMGDRTVEVFRLRGDDEVKKVQRRRRKRLEEKKKAGKGKGKGKLEAETEGDEEDAGQDSLWKDRLAPWVTIRGSGKIRSFSFDASGSLEPSVSSRGAPNAVRVLLSLTTNSLEAYSLPPPSSTTATAEASLVYGVTLPGHRTDVRALAVSSDDQLLASGSNGSVKVWNVQTQQCVRTLDSAYVLCLKWLPGDRHIIAGTKAGHIMLYDLAASQLLETVEAHAGPVWSLSIRPDGRGLVSGSADKDVKFWTFEANALDAGPDGTAEAPAKKVLTMVHTRTLKMSDDVLGVQYSPDGRLLAVSLLDATVKVFFQDTLKFLLSLYGHKLPVLAMDISHDSKLIVTCSADKNVKIWGLDFGDCHRSLFAHEESVMQVAFEKGSHMFWTVGKDRMVKYWDGDKFECVQKLEGHQGEVWALGVSQKGNFAISASHDKSLRIWEKTDEPLFLEEERERELELLYAAEDARQLGDLAVRRGDGEEGEIVPEAVSKQTAETLTAGEKIIEALDISEADSILMREHEEAKERANASGDEKAVTKVVLPARHPILAASGDSAKRYVLKVMQRVPPAALQDALLVLPFSKIPVLLAHLDHWAARRWHIYLTWRILSFIIRTHHSQLVATGSLRTRLVSLQENVTAALEKERDTIGYNLAALKLLKAQADAKRTQAFYEQEVLGANGVAPGEQKTEEMVRQKIADGAKKKRKLVLK